MSSIKCVNALRKVAAKESGGLFNSAVSSVSDWVGKNPDLTRALLYGGSALIGTSLLGSLFRSDNKLGWALPAALIAGTYGYKQPEVNTWIKDLYDSMRKKPIV